MPGKTVRTLVVVLFAACIVLPNAWAQEGMPPMGAPEEMKSLAKYDGAWDVAFSLKIAPEADWADSPATCEFKMVLDGAAQQLLFNGNMMGMPFSGMGLTSFNRSTGKWQTTWVDNMMASISLYEGEMSGNTLVVSGKDKMGDHEVISRMSTTFVSDDEITWLMESSKDEGKTFNPGAKATYTRKK